MKCKNCGHELSDTAKFCNRCGTPVKATSVDEVLVNKEMGHTIELPDLDVYEQEKFHHARQRTSMAGNQSQMMSQENRIPEQPDFLEPKTKEKRKNSGKTVRKRKNKLYIALAVICLLVVVISGGIVARYFILTDSSINEPSQRLSDSKYESGKQVVKETKEEEYSIRPEETVQTEKTEEEQTTEKAAETNTDQEETKGPSVTGSLTEMDYVGSDTMDYPTAPDSFTEVKSPDGTYTFKYPKNFFKTGYYNSDTKSYEFQASDGQTSLTIMQQDAFIKNDPKTCANSLLEQYKPLFLVTDTSPYIHASKEVAESGYSRSVIGGAMSKNPALGKYIVTATNSQTTYTMILNYNAVDNNGAGIDYTPTGYLVDCIYRGWSISGSTYKLRTYKQYLNDEMGSKK